jgi:hypothetical protein
MARIVLDCVSWLIASARTVTGEGLRACIAADAGDDRHQRGKRHHPRDRGFEQADDGCGDESGAEIGDQPSDAALVAVDHRLVDVAFAHARKQQRVLAGFLLDDVDHVVDGDHAHQPAD